MLLSQRHYPHLRSSPYQPIEGFPETVSITTSAIERVLPARLIVEPSRFSLSSRESVNSSSAFTRRQVRSIVPSPSLSWRQAESSRVILHSLTASPGGPHSFLGIRFPRGSPDSASSLHHLLLSQVSDNVAGSVSIWSSVSWVHREVLSLLERYCSP